MKFVTAGWLLVAHVAATILAGAGKEPKSVSDEDIHFAVLVAQKVWKEMRQQEGTKN